MVRGGPRRAVVGTAEFWTAEAYHQNYYLENARNYGYYKERCGRTKRLKAVWGKEEYYCYHNLDSTCFDGTVVNEAGMEVAAEANVKNAPEEGAPALLPTYAIVLVPLAAALLGCMVLACAYQRWRDDKDELS